MLLPRSDRADDRLPAALRDAGAEVTEVVAYRTVTPESLDPAVLECDATRRTWTRLFSPARRHFDNSVRRSDWRAGLLRLAKRVQFAAIGPTTARAIRDGGRARRDRSGRSRRRLAWRERDREVLRRSLQDDEDVHELSHPAAAAIAAQRSAARVWCARRELATQRLGLSMLRVPGNKVRTEVSSMPGVYQQSVDQIVEECREVADLGIPAVITFWLAGKER